MFNSGHVLIKSKSSLESAEMNFAGLVLLAEIQQDGRAGSLYMVQTPTCGDEFDPYVRKPRISDEEQKELREFRDGLSSTAARLEDKFAFLKPKACFSNGTKEVVVSKVSELPVKIVETGSKITGKPSIAFPLR